MRKLKAGDVVTFKGEKYRIAHGPHSDTSMCITSLDGRKMVYPFVREVEIEFLNEGF